MKKIGLTADISKIPATGERFEVADSVVKGLRLRVSAAGRAKFVTAGGRVFAVTALGATLPQALNRAYEAVERVEFDGAQYRRDIGASALKRLGVA